MEFIKTKLDGVVIVEPKVFGDHRGFFMESWSKREFEKAGLHYDFVQDNHSSSTVKGAKVPCSTPISAPPSHPETSASMFSHSKSSCSKKRAPFRVRFATGHSLSLW